MELLVDDILAFVLWFDDDDDAIEDPSSVDF